VKSIRHIVLSCEHAGNQIPSAYNYLFANDLDVLATHRAYDIGIAPVAAAMQKVLACPLCRYDRTRLLVDVNRTQKRAVFSEFSRTLSDAEKQHVFDHYYMPYRNQLYQMIHEQTANAPVLHLSLHSFTPVLNGKVRNADIGILYDPARRRERRFACDLRQSLTTRTDLRIRRNYPYRGRSDGMTTWLRTQFPQTQYLGIEIECNQALLAACKPGDLARQWAEAIVKIEKTFR
jgi:predicted N-formylglutamate amidohydrolase